MTHEEMERTMRFILEQQAQFASNQQGVEERVTRLEKNMSELQANVSDLQTNMSQMARTQAHVNEVLAAMLETHRHTEEKLDAFIGVLERYISEGRNGGGGAGSESGD
jgi:hypothetical protein